MTHSPTAIRHSHDGSSREEKLLYSLPITNWHPSPDPTMQMEAVEALEQGRLLYLPSLAFPLNHDEQAFLRPDYVKSGGKGIKFSLTKHTLWGAAQHVSQSFVLMGMMKRYAELSQQLLTILLPTYTHEMIIADTSFRPVEVEGRIQSKRQDDSRLHVDSFASRPTQGQRILRVFTNIHPQGRPRIWRVGEDFHDVATRFLPSVSAPIPGVAKIERMLGLTKNVRTPYDHYMRGIHDGMKLHPTYQEDATQTTISFPAGSTWITFTDQVSHAAMAGQHAMEQTFMLPVKAMVDPETSPLRVLEKMKGRKLV